ncbi:KH domain-containing protein [Patescibacteria group bacterium]|jgi:predicted RNA-binding protein YlqC (UPF0109 family)|nr:KH domain-containing protein [Patescibacteria group bacterium]
MSPTPEEHDKEFVEYIVKEIVDVPDKVKVERKIDEMGVLLELTVDPTDMGKVIGKDGNTAKSIRTLLRVLGAKNNARVNLKIIEPEGGRGDFNRNRPAREETTEVNSAPEPSSTPAPVSTPADDFQAMEEEKTTPLE